MSKYRRLFFLTGMLFLAFAPVTAGEADSLCRKIVFETEGRVSPEALLNHLGLTPHSPVTNLAPEQITKRVLHFLAREGFLFARLDSVVSRTLPQKHLYLKITEGRKLHFSGVKLAGADSVLALPHVRDIRKARTLAKSEQAVTNSLKAFGENGHLFAKIDFGAATLDTLARAASAYFLEIKINPGELVRLDSIRVIGNEQTRRRIILRELRLKVGDVLRESAIASIPARLARTGFFSKVRRPELLIGKGNKTILSITVEEAGQNAFNGVIGFNPATETEPGFVSGLFDVAFGNLFGTGRKLSTHWQKRGRNTQDLAVDYLEPRLLGLPLDLAGGFEQLFQDTLYIDRKWRLRAEASIAPQMRLVGKLERASISPDTASVGVVPGSRATAAGFGLRYNSANDPVNPSSGAAFFSLLERISKQEDSLAAPGRRKFAQQRLIVDTDGYIPLRRNAVFAISLHWRQLISRQAINPVTEVFRFGGATTLRGYREEQFNGSRIAWANLELRYLFSARSRAFVFYDQGYFYRKIEENVTQGFKRGFGFGARVETALGIVGIDYALGEGDGFAQGKVHVSLINGF